MKKQDHQLVQRVLDGDITPEDFKDFQDRMRGEPGLGNLYQEYALLHHTLSEEFEGGYPVEGLAPHGVGRLLWPAMLVMAVVAVAAGMWWLRPWFQEDVPADVAVATFSVDAVWSFDGTTRNLGGATGVGSGSKLKLGQGRVSISLEPAVSAVIEGPAEVVFDSVDSLRLDRGRGYFHRGGTSGSLTVTTPRLTAVDSGTEFGLEVPGEGPDELHVTQGKVRVLSRKTNKEVMIEAGNAARVSDSGEIELMPSDGRPFAAGLGRFETLLTSPFEKSQWRSDYGFPAFSAQRIEGQNYAVFLPLGGPQPSGDNSVLLVTLGTGNPLGGEFHTDGWAGMSFFSKGEEVLFFGDSFGTKPTWSLDVKQRIPVILPEHPVAGPRTVTLRYDLRTGGVTLHDGGLPLKAPFCEGRLPPGSRFDEIRIGASAGAALTVTSLLIRSGGG